MCFGIDWCRAKSATWLKLPESSIPIQTSLVCGACLGSPQICNTSNSFPGDFHEWLIASCWSTVVWVAWGPNSWCVQIGRGGWAREPGAGKVYGSWKSLQMRILGMEAFQSLEATWIFMNFLQIESWKVTSAKIKHILLTGKPENTADYGVSFFWNCWSSKDIQTYYPW